MLSQCVLEFGQHIHIGTAAMVRNNTPQSAIVFASHVRLNTGFRETQIPQTQLYCRTQLCCSTALSPPAGRSATQPEVTLNLHQVLRLPRTVTLELHQVLRLPRKVTLELHQVLRLPRKVTLELHQVLRLARKVSLELHQVLRLPRKVTLDLHQLLRLPHRMTRRLDHGHIWNVISNARSNKCHPPNSPHTAPATQNDHPTSNRNLRKTAET